MGRLSPANILTWFGVMNRGCVTVNWTPLLANCCTVTVTVATPGLRPLGTATVMLLSLQFLALATMPLKVTVLCPWTAANEDPVSVAKAPMPPEEGETAEIAG